MRVLVACEFSGVVRRAFRDRGHDAWSCDLIPADDGSPFHAQVNVLELLDGEWDLMIAHPPCTYLTKTGVCWLYTDFDRWDKMVAGAEFFKALLEAPIPRIAVENPVMHRYAIEIIGVKQGQVVKPWQFGHPERKRAALWLKNLPLLVPTDDVYDYMLTLPKSQQNRLNNLSPGPDRAKLRSVTYTGIAEAMAEQWGTP